MGITWLADPEIGAEEIRRNAERGFRSVTLPERPHRIGFPSIFDRLLGADHRGVRRDRDRDQPARRLVGHGRLPRQTARRCQLGATLFGQLSLTACAEWVWSAWAVKYPDLKIAMSEGGIGWVAMLIDRLDNIVDRSGYGLDGFGGHAPGRRAAPQLLVLHDRRPVDDRDAPRRSASTTSCSRPTTPTATARGPTPRPSSSATGAHLPVDELRKMTHRNAAKLYRHPLPDVTLP